MSCVIALAACEGSVRLETPDGGGQTPSDPRRDAGVSPITEDASVPPGGEDDAGATNTGHDAGIAPDDAGTTTGGGRDAGPADTRVPVFVAQGYAGRTAVSCDDGRTWVADRSTEDTARCFANGVDCDHQAGRAKGIVYSHGWFVASFGWGSPGTVRRSRDGVEWETTLTGPTFGGVAGDAESSAIVLGAHDTVRSTDDGATWSSPISSTLGPWNVRRAGYAPHDGGRWILVGDDNGDSDVVVSSDGGASWQHPRVLPDSCGGATQNDGGVGYVNGAIVIVGGNGSVCRSTDGGETWTAHSVGTSVSSSEVVSTGSEVMVWGGGRVHRSTDGASWTSTAVSPAGAQIGAVARNASGTFVAVNAGWDQWYENQRWYRSTDGVTWTELAPGAAMRGHPMFQIEPGFAEPSDAGCSAR